MEAILQFIYDFYRSPWFTVFVILAVAAVIFVILRLVYRKICRELIHTVSYTREFSEEGVYEGERVIMTETIYNRSPFPLFFVDIEGYVYNDLRLEEYEFNPRHGMQLFVSRFKLLMPYMQIKRRHDIKCVKRGYYKLESVEMLISGSSRYIDSEASIYVYPRLSDPPGHPMPASAIQGDSYSRRWLMRDPFSISGVRDYTFGDPFNSINFKATARSGGFMMGKIKVNNRDFCSNRTLSVYINFQADPAEPIPTKIYNEIIETFFGYAAGLLREASYNGYKVGFTANCLMPDGSIYQRFPIYSGELHFRDILRSMACARSAPGMSFAGLLDEDISLNLRDTEIYVFTTFTDSDIDSRFRTLERMGNTVNLLIMNGKEDEDEK